MMIRHALTTIDNPHDPFDSFKAWYTFDVAAGYHSASFLGRICNYSDDLSETDQQLMVEQAIDEIVKENISGMFIKVSKEFPEKLSEPATV